MHGHDVTTKVIEQTCRLPRPGESEEPERRAQQALGLKKDDPFLVISRKRILSGKTRVIHRSFLDPAYFKRSFLADHDFAEQSLLDILESYGLRIRSRQTRIRAALPTECEMHIFQVHDEPVLSIEQSLFALHAETNKLITAEYLHATYCRWEYTIDDRRGG